jgi:hypothetical protein
MQPSARRLRAGQDLREFHLDAELDLEKVSFSDSRLDVSVVHENKVNKVHVKRNRFFIFFFLGLIKFFS